jgi:hypothetical protein
MTFLPRDFSRRSIMAFVPRDLAHTEILPFFVHLPVATFFVTLLLLSLIDFISFSVLLLVMPHLSELKVND